jgi:LSD1 subclass zinc finger protein
MAISLNCPGCKRKLSVPDNAAGKKIKCPKCETLTHVPDEAATVVAEIEEPEAAVAGHKSMSRPPEREMTARPPRKAVPDDELDEVVETPKKRPRPQEEEDLEDDERRERARANKKTMTVGAVILGVLSALVTLLAFGAVGAACWIWTKWIDAKISERDTYTLWLNISVYSACGLAVLGFFLSLYSRGILRILALLFAVLGVGGAVFGMLTHTGIIPNWIQDRELSKGRKTSHSESLPEVGAVYLVRGEMDNDEVLAFKSEDKLKAFESYVAQAQKQSPGGPGGPGRPGPSGRPSGPPERPSGPPDRPSGPPERPSGPPGLPDVIKRQLETLKQSNEVVVLREKTSVKILIAEPHVKVEVLDGDYKGEQVFLRSRYYLYQPKN